ncbi:MAG: DUF1772 domain-containing protein [Planctomycetota bacterium]|nr:DUF1772 domain-containing protein [Planctomycetota bacterium]
MMPTLQQIVLLLAVAGSGLIAGVCFAFASFLMRSFDRLGAPAAIRAMQSLNAAILRSTTMAVWFGTVILGLVAAVMTGGVPTIAAAVLYGIGALLITGRGNVPLNEALDEVDADGPEAAEAWAQYRRRWGRWNALRTVLFALASMGFAWSI